MIAVKHSSVAPRKLEQRYNKGTPENPQNAWNNFRGKKELQKNLYQIQHGLCAYCENSLDSDLGAHIEHIESKSIHPEKTFQYTNLIYSCIQDGKVEESTDNNPVSCGHAPLKKGDEYNSAHFIKPTETDVEHYFHYSALGEIQPALGLDEQNRKRAKHTVETLNLNCKRLVRQRKHIITEGYKIIKELIEDSEAIKHFVDLELTIINNQYQPFISLRKEHFEEYR